MMPFIAAAIVIAAIAFFLYSGQRSGGAERMRSLENKFAQAMLGGDHDAALSLADEIADIADKHFGKHPDTVRLKLRAAFIANVAKDFEGAKSRRSAALEMARALPARDKPVLAKALMDVAGGFRGQKDLEASRAHWESAVQTWEDMGAANNDLVQCYSQLSQIYDELGDADTADERMTRAYEVSLKVPNPPPFTASNYAHCQLRKGNVQEARRVCEGLIEDANAKGESASPFLALKVKVHLAAEEHDEAIALARTMLEEGGERDTGYHLRILGEALCEAERWEEALEASERWLSIQVETRGEDAVATWTARASVAKAKLGAGDADGARVEADRAVQLLENALAEDDSDYLRHNLEEARALRARIPD